jgi:hypothetical protein
MTGVSSSASAAEGGEIPIDEETRRLGEGWSIADRRVAELKEMGGIRAFRLLGRAY